MTNLLISRTDQCTNSSELPSLITDAKNHTHLWYVFIARKLYIVNDGVYWSNQDIMKEKETNPIGWREVAQPRSCIDCR